MRRVLNISKRASAAAAGVKDNPKFYAMVLEFTEASAAILEKKLLDDTQIESKKNLMKYFSTKNF
jgi:hypothetical protein